MAIARFRLGTQSWTYFPDWLGVFYPPDMPRADALAQYARVFDTVEVNATFHAIPSQRTVAGWTARTPSHFRFALKTPRAITHDASLDLAVCQTQVDHFLDVAALLGDRLGPLLVQLPPRFDRSPNNRRLLGNFLYYLGPRARQVAVELRHPSWADGAVMDALAELNVAWVLADGGPTSRVVAFTADFAYVRLGRSGAVFPDFSELRLDRSADLDWWAETLQAAPTRVGSIYGYACDEFAGHAPATVRMLQQRLGLPVADPRDAWPQRPLL